MVTDSCRTGQEHSTDQQQGHNMAAAAAPELPEEDWEDELMLPPRPLDWEQIVNQATTTKGGDTQEGVPLVETGDGGELTWIEPGADTEGQTRVLEEPTSGDPDTTYGEAVEFPILDEPPIVEATGGVIEMETVEVSEHPGGMTLGTTKATLASLPALPPCLDAAEVFQDMPKLEDAEPENDPREEPLVDVPLTGEHASAGRWWIQGEQRGVFSRCSPDQRTPHTTLG